MICYNESGKGNQALHLFYLQPLLIHSTFLDIKCGTCLLLKKVNYPRQVYCTFFGILDVYIYKWWKINQSDSLPALIVLKVCDSEQPGEQDR